MDHPDQSVPGTIPDDLVLVDRKDLEAVLIVANRAAPTVQGTRLAALLSSRDGALAARHDPDRWWKERLPQPGETTQQAIERLHRSPGYGGSLEDAVMAVGDAMSFARGRGHRQTEPAMSEASEDVSEDPWRRRTADLATDLESAVHVAWLRGAHDWVRLNYPTLFDRFSKDLDTRPASDDPAEAAARLHSTIVGILNADPKSTKCRNEDEAFAWTSRAAQKALDDLSVLCTLLGVPTRQAGVQDDAAPMPPNDVTER